MRLPRYARNDDVFKLISVFLNMLCNPKMVSVGLAGILLVIRKFPDQVYPEAARFTIID